MNAVKYHSFNQETLDLMLTLRICGFSITTLSLMFNCDKKTIRNKCGENKVNKTFIEISMNDAARRTIEHFLEDRWLMLEGIRYNKGLNYKEYIRKNNSPR